MTGIFAITFINQPKLLHKFARKKKGKMEEEWNIMDMGYKEGRKWCTRKKMHVIDEDPCRMHGGASQHILCQP